MAQRWGSVVTVSAAVAVFAAAVYVIAHHDRVPDAGQTPGFSLATELSATPTAPATTHAARVRLIAFLGDDYAAAVGASDTAHGFVTLLARRLGVTARPFSVRFGGYAEASPAGSTYVDRLAALAAAQPDVVVVTGGRNDRSDDPASLASQVKSLFRKLHDRMPGVQLIAVSPFWGDSDLPPELISLGNTIRSAVRSVGGTYLAVKDPLHDHPAWMADDVDPNDAGYAAIAAALAPRLMALIRVP